MNTARSDYQRTLDSLAVQSPAMQAVVAAARRLAVAGGSVFVDGEAGSGRKMLARIVHEEGRQGHMPLVSVRCDMLSVDAMDRILLGDHRTNTIGKLEEAADGTLLLADLDLLNPVAQERLMSLLDRGRYTTSNGESRLISCRLLCTGDAASIREKTKSGQFSPELFERLSASTVRMPSLKERREDIPQIVVEVLRSLAEREHIDAPRVPYHYMELLMNVAWPDNVRQLRNHVESVMVLSGGVFDPEIIREHFATETSPATIKGAVQTLWKRLRGAATSPTLATERQP
jgi:two-component system nitrogen regulation response regulator GlnG